jgi:uncharacterized membrane protein YbhN (UPF0104 family)
MMKSFVTILQYVFFLGLGVLFVWLTVRGIGTDEWQHIKLSLKNARHWVILPVLAFLLLSHYLRALRWKLLMAPLGYAPTTFNTFAVVMIGYLVNAGVPRLGEVVKCTLLAKYEKLRADRLVGTIVIERIIDLVCLLVVFFLALIFQWHVIGDFTINLFGNFFSDNAGKISSFKVFLFLTIVAFILLAFYFILKRFGHIDIIVRVKKIIIGILHGLNSIRLVRQKALFLLYTVAIWGLYLMSTTAGIYALHETDHLGFAGGLTTLAIGSVGMIITPGGIGAYPLLVAKLVELYGLDFDTIGTALGWLLWSAQTVIILVAGVVFFALFSIKNKRLQASESNS